MVDAGAQLPKDTELVQRLQDGDEAAFVLVLDRWSTSMLRVARSFVRSQDLAEEVVQETWAAVIKGLPRFEGRSSLKTWVYTILSNRARSRAVREARTVPFSALGDLEGGEPMDADKAQAQSSGSSGAAPSRWPAAPEASAFDREAMAALREALTALPPAQLAVVVLRDVEGFGSKQVCNLLEISESNQRVLLHRGRLRLRMLLHAHMEGR